MSVNQLPIQLAFQSATGGANAPFVALDTFSSYSFDRSILQPGNPFRFTAPGVDKKKRMSIRSGDLVQLSLPINGKLRLLSTGIVDESDAHISPRGVEYVLTGRDMIGQLVDNTAVDAENKIQHFKSITIATLTAILIQNTRIPPQIVFNPGVPNGPFVFRTNPGETKISALQRYLEFINCLVWCASTGQIIIGKPNIDQSPLCNLTCSSSNPSQNNVMDARVRRNTNTAIRKIAYTEANLKFTSLKDQTYFNTDSDLQKLRGTLVGKSVYQDFNYAGGQDLVNLFKGTGQTNPYTMGQSLAFRYLARDNIGVLQVECVVKGHVDVNGNPYDIDRVYNVQIEDEDINQPLYCYAVRYDLTLDYGMVSTLQLTKLENTIVSS